MNRAFFALLACFAVGSAVGKSTGSADGNFRVALRVSGLSWQKSVGYQDRFVAGPFGQVRNSIGHAFADLRMGRAGAECAIDGHDRGKNAV